MKSDSYYSMLDKVKFSDEEKHKIVQTSIESLNSHKRYSMKSFLMLIPAACVMLFILCYSPSRVFAEKIFLQLACKIHINNEEIQIGNKTKLDIKLPLDMASYTEGRTMYQYKTYNTIKEIEDDIHVSFLHFKDAYTYEKDGVLFQVVNESAGMVTLIFSPEESMKENQPYAVNMYFSTKDGVDSGQLEFNSDSSYISYDSDSKLNKETLLSKQYEIEAEYESEHLETQVVIVNEDVNSDEQKVDEKKHAVFVYQNIEYQIAFRGDIETLKTIIEDML